MSAKPLFKPARPIPEVMAEAKHARPPIEDIPLQKPDLVELRDHIPSLQYGMHYSSVENFAGIGLSQIEHAPAQRPVAEALAIAANTLEPHGYGLIIHDAYRPWYLSYVFWHVVPEHLHHFVANPARGSMHNRGLAVDVALYDLRTGNPCQMPSEVDELSERARVDYPGGDEPSRQRRDLLQTAMTEAGFESLIDEWWHFALRTDPLYPIMNVPVDQIEKA
ncbi:M15 family metallopeptidase [Mucisphaera sp.]|uniref:M15 family metallopeptidase n=1 Tax=Mucisphaera sp. TaxID=2913024 RepID=UPI003D138447